MFNFNEKSVYAPLKNPENFLYGVGDRALLYVFPLQEKELVEISVLSKTESKVFYLLGIPIKKIEVTLSVTTEDGTKIPISFLKRFICFKKRKGEVGYMEIIISPININEEYVLRLLLINGEPTDKGTISLYPQVYSSILKRF